jgi:hypothetical protein
MPYDSYTNDSDVQFAAELDKFKLGPGVTPGGSAFAASEAMMDSMGNDYKNVAALMQARASLGGQSIEIRKRIAEDNTKQREADEFDAFLTASKDDYVAGDYVGNAQRLEQRQNDFAGNSRIDDVIGKRFTASSFSNKGRVEQTQALDWQHDENLRLEREKIETIETKLALKDRERVEKNYDSVISSEESGKVFALGQALGSTFDRDPELFDKVIATTTRLAEAGKFAEIDEITNLMKTYSGSYQLDEAYAPDIARVEELSNPFREFGINLTESDPIKKKDAYVLAQAKVNEILANPRILPVVKANWEKNFKELSDKDKILTGNQTERNAAQIMLWELFTDPPKDMNSPEAVEWKIKKNIALARASGMDARVKAQFAERNRKIATIERNFELENKHLDNAKLRQGIVLAKDNQELRNVLADMRRDQMSIDRMAVVLRMADLVDGRKFKTQDDLLGLLNDIMPEVDEMLTEGRPDVGVSGYKK